MRNTITHSRKFEQALDELIHSLSILLTDNDRAIQYTGRSRVYLLEMLAKLVGYRAKLVNCQSSHGLASDLLSDSFAMLLEIVPKGQDPSFDSLHRSATCVVAWLDDPTSEDVVNA